MKNTIDTRSLSFLSKLSFSDSELESFQKDMESIRTFFEKVSDADISVINENKIRENVLREDIPSSFEDHEKLLALSGSADREGFRVPKVVEE